MEAGVPGIAPRTSDAGASGLYVSSYTGSTPTPGGVGRLAHDGMEKYGNTALGKGREDNDVRAMGTGGFSSGENAFAGGDVGAAKANAGPGWAVPLAPSEATLLLEELRKINEGVGRLVALLEREERRLSRIDREARRPSKTDGEARRLKGTDREDRRLSGAGQEERRLSGADREEHRPSGVDREERRLSGADREEHRLSGVDRKEHRLSGNDRKEHQLSDAEGDGHRPNGAGQEERQPIGSEPGERRLNGSGRGESRLNGGGGQALRLSGNKGEGLGARAVSANVGEAMAAATAREGTRAVGDPAGGEISGLSALPEILERISGTLGRMAERMDGVGAGQAGDGQGAAGVYGSGGREAEGEAVRDLGEVRASLENVADELERILARMRPAEVRPPKGL